MHGGSDQLSATAQLLLSYLTSLKLTASYDSNADGNLTTPEFIESFSKSHSYRTNKIKGQRSQKTLLENSSVINTRALSSLTVPTADISKLHSSRRTFDTPRSLSSQRLRLSDGWRSSDGMTSSPRERSSSVDSRFARLVTSQQFPVQPESIRYYTRFTSRLRQSTSQVEMDARILQALDRTQKETAHLVLASAPWLPSTPSSKYRYNKADVFVHSSYPSDRKEGKMSPLKKTGAGSDLSSTVRTLPTPPPLRSDKQYLEERAELVARLTLYRAIRRAPWSPSRRKNIDSDFAEEVPDALGDVRAEWNGGGILGDFSAEGSGRNHLTGEYRNEHDERAFRRINTSIDEAYSEASSAETEQNRNFVPFYRQHVGVGSPQQDTYGTEWINKVENAVEVDTDAPTLENIRIEVQDPWDFTEYRSDRSEDSAQQHGFAFRGNDRPNWDDSKMAALEHIGDVSNIPSGKSSAENTRSCQESPLRIAVLPGQQAHYVLRVRVVRGVKTLNSSHRGPDFDISERHRSRGMTNGLRSSPAVTERRGILLVKGGVTKGLLLAALSAQFPSALSKIDEDVPPSSSSHIPSAPYPLSELDRTLLSMTISHTPIRSRIRVSDAFDDDRGEVRSAGENSKNNLYNSGYDSPYGRGLSTCGSPLQSIEHEHDDGMSYPNSNKKNNTNTNSTNIGNSNPHPVPVPFTPQPVVVSLTEQTLDFAPVIDESSELVLSYV